MTIPQIIEAVQEALGVDADGKAGPQTWAAIYNKIVTVKPAPVIDEEDISKVDERSEAGIATLLPQVRPLARSLIHAAKDQGIEIKITSATRTYAEQDALFAKGGVTKARGGFSNHNFGVAFDITIFKDGQPVWESPLYKVVGSLGRSLGLSWGGDWHSFQDEPHFELKPDWAKDISESEMLAEFRKRKSSGQQLFA